MDQPLIVPFTLGDDEEDAEEIEKGSEDSISKTFRRKGTRFIDDDENWDYNPTSTSDTCLLKNRDNADDLLEICGNTGIWQIWVFFLGSLSGFNTAIQSFIYTFIADVPKHWCQLPVSSKYSVNQLKSLLLPKSDDGEYETCVQYSYTMDLKGEIFVDRGSQIQCQSIDFDRNVANTIVTEWGLFCNKAVWLSSVQACFMFGLLIGSVVFGRLSDKIGRKRTIWLSSFIFFISCPVVGLAPDFITLLVARFINGFAAPGIYSTAYVLVIEVLGPKQRGLAGSLFSVPFSLGYMILPIIAYFIRDWRQLELTTSGLGILIIVCWWYLPESPRWLLLQGRAYEAEKVLRQIAKINGKQNDLPLDFSARVAKVAGTIDTSEMQKVSFWKHFVTYLAEMTNLMRYSQIRKRILILSTCFIAINLVYYGVAIASSTLNFNKYLFTFLCGLFELPSDLILPCLIQRLGRRFAFSGLLFICGAFLLISLALRSGSFMVICLAVIAQICIASDSTLIYLYASELLPTIIRTYGIGLICMVGRTGSIAAPYVVEVLGTWNKRVPTVIFGCSALFAGFLSLLLPETKDKRLPETVDDVENSE